MHMKLKTPLTATFSLSPDLGVLLRLFPDYVLQMRLRAVGLSPLDLESRAAGVILGMCMEQALTLEPCHPAHPPFPDRL